MGIFKLSVTPITENLRLDKIELENYPPFSNIVEIFPNKKLTVYVGFNGCGKTRFVDAIRSGFGLPPTYNEFEKTGNSNSINGKPTIKLETNFDSSLITKDNHFLFFYDSDDEFHELIKFFEGLSSEIKEKILLKSSDTLKLILNNKFEDYVKEMSINKSRLVLSTIHGEDHNPGRCQIILMGLSLLLSLRQHFAPNSFLILDSIFHNFAAKNKIILAKVLSQFTFQTILLVTDVEFLAGTSEIKSVKDTFDESGIDYEIRTFKITGDDMTRSIVEYK